MGLSDFLRGADINYGLQEYQAEPNAVLLDVRTQQEYIGGHIPGSQNLPLQRIEAIETVVEDRNRPIYVYCHSGGRSQQAARMLGQMGYSRVKNIGGIMSYNGKVER